MLAYLPLMSEYRHAEPAVHADEHQPCEMTLTACSVVVGG